MSYRCDECRILCEHQQIRVVTETRTMANNTQQIAKEKALCEECAKKIKTDVVVKAARNGALYQKPFEDPTVVGIA
jgi:Fe-S-cluster-containing hydrogenase component 2